MECLQCKPAMQNHPQHFQVSPQHFLFRFLPCQIPSQKPWSNRHWYCTSKQNHSYGDIVCSSCRAEPAQFLHCHLSAADRVCWGLNSSLIMEQAGMGSTSLYWSPSQWRCGEHILLTSHVGLLAHRPRNMTWRKESTFQRDKQQRLAALLFGSFGLLGN